MDTAPAIAEPASLTTVPARAYLVGMAQTLAEVHRDTKWVWVCCKAQGSGHTAPMPIAPLLIRWGMDALSDRLRGCARCSQ